MCHEAPRRKGTHDPKPQQQNLRHKNERNGKDEMGDSFQTRIWPITMSQGKKEAGFLNKLSTISMLS